jgi:opacity protein-like surface antigen
MNARLLTRTGCLAIALTAAAANAQLLESPNRIALSYRAGFNIKADIRNSGEPATPGEISVTGIAYADGFVREDISGNAGGLTSNWGYESAEQVVGDYIVMTGSQAGSIARNVDDGPVHGVEFTYHRRLGHWRDWRWGMEGAINYTWLSLDKSHTPAGNVLTAHAFGLGGIVPPAAPYAGSFEGPGALIEDTPANAVMSVQSQLDTSIVGWRAGPYIEIPVIEGVSVAGGGGFAAAWAHSDFSFRERVTVGSDSAVRQARKRSESEWMSGWYVGGNAFFDMGENVTLITGVQFQRLGKHRVQAGGKEASLDLTRAVFLSVGLTYTF